MCEYKNRVAELEKELEESRQRERESHQREAELFAKIGEGKNYESQIKWRPWQVALIPIIVAIVGAGTAIAIALQKNPIQ